MAKLPRKKLQGQESIKQIEHHDLAGAQSVTPEILAPGEVITDDLSASPGVAVGKGCLIRIQVSTDTYVTFSDDAITSAVDATTSPAIKLPSGYYILRATGALMRASTNPDRAENLGQ